MGVPSLYDLAVNGTLNTINQSTCCAFQESAIGFWSSGTRSAWCLSSLRLTSRSLSMAGTALSPWCVATSSYGTFNKYFSSFLPPNISLHFSRQIFLFISPAKYFSSFLPPNISLHFSHQIFLFISPAKYFSSFLPPNISLHFSRQALLSFTFPRQTSTYTTVLSR